MSKKPPISAIKHPADSRTNIPTAELRDFVADDENSPKAMLYPRDPSLDPQLIWKGKDEQDRADLEVPVVPIYIQEKIHPQALIEDIRATAEGGQGQADLFGDFNGIDFEQLIEFYQHNHHWSNRMILGDSLQVMASLAEKEGLKGKVQMIYLDPPYGIDFKSNWQVSTRRREVKDGKIEDLTRQPEQIKAFRDTWKRGIHSYLAYLRDRLQIAKELLTETGSVFVQISDQNIHLVRCLLDEIFGYDNFVSLITVQKAGSTFSQYLGGISDFVIWYAKDASRVKYHDIFTKRNISNEDSGRFTLVQADVGVYIPIADLAKPPKQDELVAPDPLQSASIGREKGEGAACWFSVSLCGREFRPTIQSRWKTNESGMARLIYSNRIIMQSNSIRYARRLSDFSVQVLSNIWTDLAGATDKVYVVQTSTKIVERCLLMTTDPGDLVLDPTCGSGTTAYVAEQWGRRWITTDTSRVALALARTRLMAARFPFYLLADSDEGRKKAMELTGQLPATDAPRPSGDIKKGFVYKTVPHITLKSIANNPEIDGIHAKWQETLEPLRTELNRRKRQSWEEWEVPREAETPWDEAAQKLFHKIRTLRQAAEPDSAAINGALYALNFNLKREYTLENLPERPADPWPRIDTDILRQWWEARRKRQQEIDASISRNADTETLFDQPYEDKKRVRVTGPFTVESLSPHRVLPTHDGDGAGLPQAEADAKEEAADFATMILDNLRKAGVQNTVKNERLKFDRLEPFAGGWLHAEGEYTDGEGATKRVAVSIGPEHGTVGALHVKEASKEAVKGLGFDMLLVCGFAFDPSVSEEARQYGKLVVLPVKMNPDLAMGDDLLKKTGSGNLFMVFGEPDIAPIDPKTGRLIPQKDGTLQIEIKGLDIYDPTTGQIRSHSTDDIACWFIDTNYNGESFFVRHAYFTGGDKPYEKLKKALKADIDEAAWDALYSTKSRPFPVPETGKVAVKVINHYGDEVVRVFGV